MNTFLFQQPFAIEKLNAVRISLCCIVIVLLSFGPYDSFYVDTADWLYQPGWPFPWFPNLGIHFWTLKYLVIVLGICCIVNFQLWLIGPLFAISFLFFNFYITGFSTTYWVTNTHLNFFAFALCFEYPKNRVYSYGKASFILAFMITYIAVLYFQAGLSKVIAGGFNWFFDGERIWIETILLGTPFGKWLTQWPWIFIPMSLGTGVFELILPFGFFFLNTRKIVAGIAIMFHLLTFAIMGITFWFLWALFPAIFFYNPPLAKKMCFSLK